MDQIAAAYAKLTIDQSGFTSGIGLANKSLGSFAAQVAATAVGFTGGMGLMNVIDKTRQLVVASVKDWAEYEKAMLAVSTLVDTSKVNMSELSDQVVELSSKYGRDKKGLASALYETLSAGVEAGKAMQFLETATKAAIGGITDSKTVVDGLTSSIAAYGADASQAEEFSDSLFTTIKVGKTTMEELSGTMGQVAPLANAVGMSFDELGASIATLTLSGLSTSEAGTAMRGMLNAIIKPSEEAKKMAEALGIEFDISAVKTKGFSKFLEELMYKTGGSTKALSMLFPEVRGLNGAIQLTGDGFLRFNSTMDEMQAKAGATTEAADKMKEALSYKWDIVVENMKNLGKGIGDNLEGPLKAALDTFNTIASKGRELSKNMTPVTDKSSLEDLQAARDRAAKLRDDLENAQIARGGQPTALIEGLWKEIAAYDELIKKKTEEANAQKILDDNAKEAQRVRQEEINRKKEAAAVEAELKARALENDKKNTELQKENADTLKQIENDRLSTQENISRLSAATAQLEIENQKKVADAIHKGRILEYSQIITDLQSRLDNEALSANERLEINKKLFDAKKKLLESDRENELSAIKFKTDQEKIAAWERVKTIENEMEKLDAAYKENVDNVKKSSIKNKEQVLKNLAEQHNAEKLVLTGLVKDHEKAYNEVEKNGKKAADNINKEFTSKVATEFKASVNAALKINTEGMMTGSDNIFSGLLNDYNNLKDAIQSDNGELLASWGYDTKEGAEKAIKQMKMSVSSQFTSLFSQTASIVTNSIRAIKTDLSVGIESLVGDIGHAVGAAGQSAGNAYVAIIGEVVGVFGDVLAMLDQEYDLWGSQQEEVVKKTQETYRNILSGLDSTMRRTEEWLKLIGEKDYSNMSIAELRDEKMSVAEKMATEVSSATGIKGLTGQDWLNLTSVTPDTVKADKSVLDALLKSGKLTKSQYDTITYVQGQTYTRADGTKGSFSETYSGFTDALSTTKRESSQALLNIDSAMGANKGIAGIDPLQSQSKEDFIADLQSQLSTGKITESQFNKLMYDAAFGLGDYKNRQWSGLATSDWFNATEKADIAYKMTGSSSGQSSSVWGAQSAPVSIAGEQAVASVMSAPQEQTININVNNYIDPNIPINQDSALAYSEQIASSLSRTLFAQGVN